MRLEVSAAAHVAYLDLVSCRRRNMDPLSEKFIGDTIYQMGALQGFAKAAGARVRYVKPHGAPYSTIAQEARKVDDALAAIKAVDSWPGDYLVHFAELELLGSMSACPKVIAHRSTPPTLLPATM
ncbi:LamB/YcsF family protein [Sinorhizobium sp. BJ1]|uniref:LamB/YcsF family protein n=1 Tax=Sinorhizobium sp. BJ1 TaxID=2035455 RepID=UPI0032AFB4EA